MERGAADPQAPAVMQIIYLPVGFPVGRCCRRATTYVKPKENLPNHHRNRQRAYLLSPFLVSVPVVPARLVPKLLHRPYRWFLCGLRCTRTGCPFCAIPSRDLESHVPAFFGQNPGERTTRYYHGCPCCHVGTVPGNFLAHNFIESNLGYHFLTCF